MNHDEAKAILSRTSATISLDEEYGTASLDGEFSIEELHAILQLLEYTA